MQLTASRTNLVSELDLAIGTVEKKTTIPILANVYLQAEDGQLRITATDLECGLRTYCDAEVKEPGIGTIPAKRLLDYVRSLPVGDLSVKSSGSDYFTVASGRSRARIAGMSGESFPQLPEEPAEHIVLPDVGPIQFAGMIAKVDFAISVEESRFTLSGALLSISDGKMRLVATDGHRLTYLEKAVDDGLKFEAIISRRGLGELRKLGSSAVLGDRVIISSDENHLFFRIGKRLLVSRKVAGNFPDYRRVLPSSEGRAVLTVDRQELIGAAGRVRLMSDERTRALKITSEENELVFTSSVFEAGEAKERIGFELAGELKAPVETGLNADYVLDFARAVDTEKVELHYLDWKSAVKMVPAGGDSGYVYVCMPLRV